MEKIRIAVVGVGNCACSLLQGIEYYRHKQAADAIGLMHWAIGGYRPSSIEVVAAFDIDKRKVGRDVNEAIFAKPNCTAVFCPSMPKTGVKVTMGKILDGVADHMADFEEDYRFVVAHEREPSFAEVVEMLKDTNAEVLVNYLPVGSEEATKFYVEAALEAGIAFINNIPVFIASNAAWAKRFEERGLPIIGDDIKSQLGATITHRTLTDLFKKRGVKLDRTYQLNTGGNTDFLNMLNRTRLKSKKESKTEAVQSVAAKRLPKRDIHIGPSDYVPWQNDNKVCYLRIEGRGFGGFPVTAEMRLSVEDSPNSAGCSIDAIRACKIARDRKIGGPLISISAYTMKHPPKQIVDYEAKDLVRKFIQGTCPR